MPELFDVATHFDDITAYDGYSGAAAFKGQFNTHDETAISGSTERKRTMSVAPGTSLPARRVIKVFDERYIVGDGNTDGIFDRAIRKAYWLKRADTLAIFLTPGQLLSASAGKTAYVNRDYMKDTVNSPTDSEYDPFWRIYAALGETLPKGYFVSVGGALLRVRTSHEELSGFIEAQCDELDGPAIKTATVPGLKVYDPVTDSYTGSNSTVSAILLESYKLYKYLTRANEKVGSGDMSAILPVSVAVGQTITIDSVTYRVADSKKELDAYAHHLVRL